MKKLAILGKGTAGSLSFNHFSYFTDLEIEVYYDSKIKERSVGEGTTINVVQDLGSINKLDFYEVKEKLDATYKTGINYINWGNNDFMHTFPMPYMSLHFNATKLQKYLFDKHKEKINFIDKNIIDLKEIKADYILDCRGAPKDFKNYYKSKYIPVNSVLLNRIDQIPNFDYTKCIAFTYGWIFVIPLKNNISIGYLFNKDLNDIEEVKNDFIKFLNINNYEITNINNLNFDNYWRKTNFKENISYNGNSSFFLEPMEATSLSTVNNINRRLFDYLHNVKSLENINNWYLSLFKEIEVVINLHYYANNNYNNIFWNYAKDLAKDCLKENKDSLDKIIYYSKNNIELDNEYGTWFIHSFKQNFKGLNLYDF